MKNLKQPVIRKKNSPKQLSIDYAQDHEQLYNHAIEKSNMSSQPSQIIIFSETNGVRYLHFDSEWVQGAMRLKKPWYLELEYAQQMMAWLLFLDPPQHIVQLGLGAASLTKFCYHRFTNSQINVVELNSLVITAARSMFALPDNDERLNVIHDDAYNYIHQNNLLGKVGVLQVDCYDAQANGPTLSSLAFYRACRNLMGQPAIATINLFGEHPSFQKNMKHLKKVFNNRVIALPATVDGNRIAIAFNGPALRFPFSIMQKRAQFIKKTWGLPALEWLEELKIENTINQDNELII